MAAKYLLIPVMLLALSVTYAGFSDTLFIGDSNAPNTVTTMDMEWSLDERIICRDGILLDSNGINPLDPSSINYDNEFGRIVECSENSISDDTTKITIRVDNAYPGYAFGIDFCITNTGNLPSKLRDVVIDAPDKLKNSARVAYQLDYSVNGGATPESRSNYGLTLAEFENEIESELNGKIFTTNGYICFGDEDSNTIWIYFPPDSNPPQGQTLEFNITFVFGQFNE